MDAKQIFREKGYCCISGKPMKDSEHINIEVLPYAVEWEFPYAGVFLIPNQPKKAIAIVHDDLYAPGDHYLIIHLVKWAIELRDDLIIYHDVTKLKQIRYAPEN